MSSADRRGIRVLGSMVESIEPYSGSFVRAGYFRFSYIV
jgi:hypothetical protein